MATIPTSSFIGFVQTIASGVQGRATQIIDFAVGSVLRAIAEGFASVCLWLQTNILQVAKLTRASSSTGSDLDSFYADWGNVPGKTFARLPGTFATGSVTFSVASIGSTSYFVPVGATVQSIDGTASFSVTADTTNTAYVSTPVAGYTVAAGVGSVTVPVQCTAAGPIGNVAAGAISVMTSPITGISTVTNGSAFTNGTSPETDAQFRARFPLFIASLSQGTIAAVTYAVASLQAGAQATVIENATQTGTGTFDGITVTVDDGSGAPPASFMTAANTAVNATRAGGVPYSVLAPIVIQVSVAITLGVATGYNRQAVIAVVQPAVMYYINTLPLGTSLSYLALVQTVLNSTPGVIGTGTLITLNSNILDVTATQANVIKITSNNLTVA